MRNLTQIIAELESGATFMGTDAQVQEHYRILMLDLAIHVKHLENITKRGSLARVTPFPNRPIVNAVSTRHVGEGDRTPWPKETPSKSPSEL